MSKVVEKYTSKWLSVHEKTLDNGSTYMYSHAGWCNSQGVAILPFRRKTTNAFGFSTFEFLGRYEICPAHSDDVELCSITGGMDKEGEMPVFTAMRELIEEGGYKVPVENIEFLGTVRPSKASDNTMFLYAVDLDIGAEEVEATGDGTLGEEGAYCDWVDAEQLLCAKDPLLHTMMSRLAYEGHLNPYS